MADVNPPFHIGKQAEKAAVSNPAPPPSAHVFLIVAVLIVNAARPR
jgi:hypothetical protein